MISRGNLIITHYDCFEVIKVEVIHDYKNLTLFSLATSLPLLFLSKNVFFQSNLTSAILAACMSLLPIVESWNQNFVSMKLKVIF